MRIIYAVSNKRFEKLPILWRDRGEYDGRSVGRFRPSADYLYCNIHPNRDDMKTKHFASKTGLLIRFRTLIHGGGTMIPCQGAG